jgi:hypothetical protein
MRYKKKYAEIMIPKGTLLFRYTDDKKVHPVMRFGLCSTAAAMITPDEIEIIQIWIAKENIYGVYFVSQVLRNGNKINATNDAYKSLMGMQICPLCVPLDKNPDRQEFIEKLRNNFRITSWVTSVICKTEMELILFTSNNYRYVKFHSSFKVDGATNSDEQWNLYITKSFRQRKFTGHNFKI